MTCCFFSSLKTLLTCGGYRPHAQINVLSAAIYGRFSGDHLWPVLGVHRGQDNKPQPGDQIKQNLIGGLKAAKKGRQASDEFYDRMVANRLEEDDKPWMIRE